MDDDIDIYADLSITETKKEPVQIVTQNVELEKKFSDLENEVKALRLENEVLNRNISSLLKTAQAEISRKDNVIAELRKQLDNAAFRRGKFQTNSNRNFSNKRGERTYQSQINNIKQETHDDKKVSAEYTEYLCHSHSHGEDNSYQPTQEETFKKRASRVTGNINSGDEDEKNQKYDSSKVYNTLYGDRLRKKLMAEEEEQRKAKEERRLKEEERKQEDEKQRKKEEEERRLKEDEDRRRENEKQRRRDEERRLKEEERRYEEEKQRRKEEEKRHREEQLKKKEREERKLEEEKRVREAYQRKKDDERWKRDEEKRPRDDYQRKKDNERRKKDEEKRGREEHPRKKDEERRYKDEQKKREEERNSQEMKVKEVQRKRDEERRRREDERKAREDERRIREEERKAREEEQRIQEEGRKLKEEKVRLEKMIREEDRQQRIAQQIAEVARVRSAELEEQRKKVLENKENHRLSRWPDVRESAESRKAQSVSSEEYAARLMRLHLKRDVDYSNQRRTNQDVDLQESQRSDKDAPHDPRRMKNTETGDRRRKNSTPGNRSRSSENLRDKRFSPERCKNDSARNKPHSDYSSRYPNHNNEISRYGPQSHSQKNDYHCRNDRLPDHRKNCKDRNWPEVVQERYCEDRKRKCGSLDRDSHHLSKKHRLEDEIRNESEGERCKQEVVVDEIESPDELEDGEIASMEANDTNLHNKPSSWDLENEQKQMVAEDEESLEKIEQQLQEYNETKNVNHVPFELPKEKFTDTQLKNVLETSFELESPGKAGKSPRSKSRSHSRSQSRSQSRDKEETKKEQNLKSIDELESKYTVEPMVVDQEDTTKPVDEYVSSDTQKCPNSDLGVLNEGTELEKISKTEQSGCDKSGVLEVEEDETEIKVKADKMVDETKDMNRDEVERCLKLNEEMKPSNPEKQVPDHRPKDILSEPETTPLKNHQLPSLTTSTPVGKDAVVDPHQKSDDIKDSEPLDLNIKLEISISPTKKSSPDKNNPSEEDKTISNGTVESDSKDKTTTSDKTSSSSSSEMDEDKSPGLPQLNLSESEAEEPQDNVASEIVSQPVADGAPAVSNKTEEETNQVPQDNPVTETSKESSEGSSKLDDKMYELFGSEQSNGPSAMFSPVMEVEVETSDTVDSPGKKLEDIKEEETEETEDEELIDMPEPEDKSSFKPQTTSILGSLLQYKDKVVKISRFSSDEIQLGIKLERADQVWGQGTGGTVAELPNTFGAFRRRKKVVVSVGKVKKSNTKDAKIQNLLDRKEDKVRQVIEDLIEEKSNPGTILKKEAVAKKVTAKTEKKGPIVFKRRRPKHLSDSSSCFTVD